MDTVIADIDYNYFGYAPAHPDGLIILKTTNGYDIARRVHFPGTGYRHLAFAHATTEAEARATANAEYRDVTTSLRAAAVVKDLGNAENLAAATAQFGLTQTAA